jgi:hypothetical protein
MLRISCQDLRNGNIRRQQAQFPILSGSRLHLRMPSNQEALAPLAQQSHRDGAILEDDADWAPRPAHISRNIILGFHQTFWHGVLGSKHTTGHWGQEGPLSYRPLMELLYITWWSLLSLIVGSA